MNISSRTPEGEPVVCPLCGEVCSLEISDPAGDAVCPSCGQLVWWFRDRLQQQGVATGDEPLEQWVNDELPVDSVTFVEMVMELEEQFDINMPLEAAERINSVADVIRWMRDNGYEFKSAD